MKLKMAPRCETDFWQYRDCTDSYVIVTCGASFDTGHYVCLLCLGE